ncbi:ATP-dependent dethiobiotin synthetase BioD [Sphingopyxis sp. GW247-27LB]|uniref:ATP-dependent dethiobiotin synthetase BioD n=1 Tax=Sphingopyxis sp. GW247-27LB TaxID=2012632 RepID=UPI000BA7E292|nr:ATP-dependent dethiobiotin synthetase BioD [Sphingopyxis sp. GW247-27LB]PAL23635.1 dethiobiotin synthase [Sphingopyxis sp. GW247-27LB]
MTRRFVVTGTDTGIGKTVFSAALAGALHIPYWKPIQSGLEEETDSATVARLLPARSVGRGTAREASGGGATTAPDGPSVSPPGCHLPTAAPQGGSILPEAYRLKTPASPHLAAEIDGVTIDPEKLTPPEGDLLIEGAGGALVPVTRTLLYADLFARWQIPVIVCARTGLGTINHSLLTIEALTSRGVPIHGLAFLGDRQEDSEAIIADLGGVRRLGRLPIVDPLTPENLAAAFASNFELADFR